MEAVADILICMAIAVFWLAKTFGLPLLVLCGISSFCRAIQR
jgi:hypothetical protein